MAEERVAEADPIHDHAEGRRGRVRELPCSKKSVRHAGQGRHDTSDEIVVLELEDAEAGSGPSVQSQTLSPIAPWRCHSKPVGTTLTPTAGAISRKISRTCPTGQAWRPMGIRPPADTDAGEAKSTLR